MKSDKSNFNFYFLLSLIFLFAFILRLWHLKIFSQYHLGGSYFYGVDFKSYEDVARNFLAGKWLIDPPFRPPLTSFFLYLLLRISDSYFFIKTFFSILSSLMVILTGLIGRKIFDDFTGIFSAFLVSVNFGLIMMVGSITAELPAMIFLYFLILISLKFQDRFSFGYCLIIGILNGLLSLTRAEFLFFPAIVIFLIFKNSFIDFRNKLKWSLVSLIFLILPILPWGWRNYLWARAINQSRNEPSVSTFIPLTLYGGYNFAKAHSPYNLPYFDRRTWGVNPDNVDEITISLDDPNIRNMISNGYFIGFKYIASHPFETLLVSIKKVLISLKGLGFGWGPINFPLGLRGYFYTGDCFVPEKPYLFYLFFTFTVLGMIRSLKNRRKGMDIIFSILLFFLIVIISFFGYVRIGLMLFPLFGIFISFVLQPLSLLWKKLLINKKPFLNLIALGGGLIIIYSFLLFTARGEYRIKRTYEFFFIAEELYKDGSLIQAKEQFLKGLQDIQKEKAVLINPIEFGAIHFKLGEIALKTGDYEQAIKEYQLSLKNDPIHPRAHSRIGYIYFNFLNSPQKAKYHFIKHLRLNPLDPQANAIRTLIYKIDQNLLQKQ